MDYPHYVYALLGVLYMTPTLVAIVTRPRRIMEIVAANMLLGWTVVVWFACLYFALFGRRT